MADRGTLFFAFIFFLIQISVAVILLFLPAQISAMLGKGVSATIVGSVVAIPWAFATLATYLLPRAAARAGKLRLYRALSLAAAAIGLAASSFSSPTFAVIARVNTIANIGGFVSPNIKAWADSTFASPSAGLFIASGVVLLVAGLFMGLGYLGRKSGSTGLDGSQATLDRRMADESRLA